MQFQFPVLGTFDLNYRVAALIEIAYPQLELF